MLEIMHLADRMDLFPVVTGWIYKEWGGNGARSDVDSMTRHCLCPYEVPQTFVALLDGKPAGMASLWRNDLKSRQDLTPWLACLYVADEFRRKGIGARLQRFAAGQAGRLGYPMLYLITNLDGYYEKTGWSYLGDEPLMDGAYVKLYARAAGN